MIPINKIIIDSHFKMNGSVSNSDFSIELPETVQLPDNLGAMITDITIPNTFYTIDTQNNRLYLRMTHRPFGSVSTLTDDLWLQLDSRNYSLDTLSTALAAKINATFPPTNVVSSTFDENLGSLKLIPTSADVRFKVLTDEELRTNVGGTWSGLYYNTETPNSCNDVLRNSGISPLNTADSPYVSGFVDTMAHHNVYITSPQLGTFQNIGPRGERTILKKVVVDVEFGGVITDKVLNAEDYTNCSRQVLKTLSFRICDVHGSVVDLHGAHVSFCIVFRNI